jgi:hypothetical protein
VLRLAPVPALGGLPALAYCRQGIRNDEAGTEAALRPEPEPTERDGYRTEESSHQDSRKYEHLQRNLILAHVLFST